MNSSSSAGSCGSLVVEVEVEVSGLAKHQATGSCSNGSASPNKLDSRNQNLLELDKSIPGWWWEVCASESEAKAVEGGRGREGNAIQDSMTNLRKRRGDGRAGQGVGAGAGPDENSGCFEFWVQTLQNQTR